LLFPNLNLLPSEGEVFYFGKVFSEKNADFYLERLLNTIEWKNDDAFILGKHIITKRKVAWYGDRPFSYTYSKSTKYALPWTSELLELKKIAEEKSGSSYNSCLLNLYHNNEEGMAYHSYDEKMLKDEGAIASLSFGAQRNFLFRHKKAKENNLPTITVTLEHGSLLVMQGATQKNWLHRLPPTKKLMGARVNLTFRTIVQFDDVKM
jgi:alkylated DNA repair dioxygenase AlkB